MSGRGDSNARGERVMGLGVLLLAVQVIGTCHARPAAFAGVPRALGARAAPVSCSRASPPPAWPRPGPRGARSCALARMCAGPGAAEEPYCPLAEIQDNDLQQQLAVARQDYSAAQRLRDTNQRLRERDEFTRLSLHLEQATADERFEDAAPLRDKLIAVSTRRAAAPPPLNRLLLLKDEGALASCVPDGSACAHLGRAADGSRWRLALPTWSPSGDMVACVAYTGTAMSSTVDAKHYLVVLQARDGKQVLLHQVDFPPYLLQWSGSGTALSYVSRSLRARSQIVSIDVLPRAPSVAGVAGVGNKRSTRDTVRARVLHEGDLLFFTHIGVSNGGYGMYIYIYMYI